MLPDAVPVLGEQGHGRRAGAEQAALVLRLEPAVLEGRATLHAADPHHHAHGVGDDLLAGVLAVGAGLAEGRDRRHHQVGVDRRQRPIAEAQVVQVTRAVALDHQVNVGHEFLQDAPAGAGLQVEGDALLVQIEDQEEEALFRVRIVVVVRPDPPHGRPAGRFDLEHVGSIVRQQPRAKRPGDILAQVQHLDSAQRRVKHGGDFIPSRRRRQFGHYSYAGAPSEINRRQQDFADWQDAVIPACAEIQRLGRKGTPGSRLVSSTSGNLESPAVAERFGCESTWIPVATGVTR